MSLQLGVTCPVVTAEVEFTKQELDAGVLVSDVLVLLGFQLQEYTDSAFPIWATFGLTKHWDPIAQKMTVQAYVATIPKVENMLEAARFIGIDPTTTLGMD